MGATLCGHPGRRHEENTLPSSQLFSAGNHGILWGKTEHPRPSIREEVEEAEAYNNFGHKAIQMKGPA